MFFYKKIYNLIIIFTLIILTCLNNKCDPDKITESLSKSQSKSLSKSQSKFTIPKISKMHDLYSNSTKDEVDSLKKQLYKFYKDTFNNFDDFYNYKLPGAEKNASVDLTIKTLIEDNINLLLNYYNKGIYFRFTIDNLKEYLEDYTGNYMELADLSRYLIKRSMDIHSNEKFNKPINDEPNKNDRARHTQLFIYVTKVVHIIFNFINENEYDKSKIDKHPLFSYYNAYYHNYDSINTHQFALAFYSKIKKEAKKLSNAFGRDYFNWWMKTNKHMQLNVIKYRMLHSFFTIKGITFEKLSCIFNGVSSENKKETINKHLSKLSLLRCQEDDKIKVNCVKEFLKNNKSFFDTKVYKFFKDKTIFVK